MKSRILQLGANIAMSANGAPFNGLPELRRAEELHCGFRLGLAKGSLVVNEGRINYDF